MLNDDKGYFTDAERRQRLLYWCRMTTKATSLMLNDDKGYFTDVERQQRLLYWCRMTTKATSLMSNDDKGYFTDVERRPRLPYWCWTTTKAVLRMLDNDVGLINDGEESTGLIEDEGLPSLWMSFFVCFVVVCFLLLLTFLQCEIRFSLPPPPPPSSSFSSHTSMLMMLFRCSYQQWNWCIPDVLISGEVDACHVW